MPNPTPRAKANKPRSSKALHRPSPDEVVHSELNLERWPRLWAISDQSEGESVRTYERTLALEDGSVFKAQLSIDRRASDGDLTRTTRKLFLAVAKLMQENWGRTFERAPADRRIPFTTRRLAQLMQPGARDRDSAWGGKTLADVKRHMRRLQRVNLRVNGWWYDKESGRRVKVESGFSLIDHYVIAEERKPREGEGALAEGLGYIKVNDLVFENLARGYTAPLYLTDHNSLKSPWASTLYQQLNLAFGREQRVYKRRLDKLFDEDYPEMARKYPYPSDRKRVTQTACRELVGKRLANGTIERAEIEPTKDGRHWNLEVARRPYAANDLALEKGGEGGLLELAVPSPTRGFGSWLRSEPDSRDVEETDVAARIRHHLDLAPAESRDTGPLGLLLHEIEAQTRKPSDRRHFSHVLQDRELFQDLDRAAQAVRRWMAEIRQGEHDGLAGNAAMKLTTIYRQECERVGLAPYWQRRGRAGRRAA